MATARQLAADLRYAHIARRAGMRNSLRTAWEARAAGISATLGYALVEQETGNGANVFGHDPTIFVGAGKVTKAKYTSYKAQRGPTGGGGMQGVGPLQLTWFSTQDAADKLGGCHVPKFNLRQGFRTLAANIKAHGEHDGIKAYNGSGPAAEAYAKSVLKRQAHWHRLLVGY